MKLVFVTSNQNKVIEINELLPDSLEIQSLKDVGITEEIPETQDTIEGNSLQKAETVYQRLQLDCFAEDTGLEVDALGGEPGVYSARYAGEAKDANSNMNLVLDKLNGQSNRNAQFKTVITLILSGKVYQFEGILKGVIAKEKKGDQGFGYDPIFCIDDRRSLAELDLKEKSKISHRGKAVKLLLEFLQKQYI